MSGEVLRLFAIGAFTAAFGGAPMQCGHAPDPNLRREDTAGDALWDLSEQFYAQHNEAAARETLRYMVDHYPSNRHTEEAKSKLAQAASSASARPPGADAGG